jgi:hypothetical protein
MEMAVDLMVIPRSISSCLYCQKRDLLWHYFLAVPEALCTYRVSVNRISPALAPAMIPALETKESVRVDLPWSTWAMTDMFRMLEGRSTIEVISKRPLSNLPKTTH